jgi:hypothetical protein
VTPTERELEMNGSVRGAATLAILILAAGCAAEQAPVKLEPVVVHPAQGGSVAPAASYAAALAPETER